MLTLNQLIFQTFGYYFDLRRIPRIATGREHHWSMEKQTKNCGSSVSSSRQSFANLRHLGTLTNRNTNAYKHKYNKYKALVCFLLLPSCTGCMHHGRCGPWSNEKLIGVAQWAKKESTFLFWFSRNISFSQQPLCGRGYKSIQRIFIENLFYEHQNLRHEKHNSFQK